MNEFEWVDPKPIEIPDFIYEVYKNQPILAELLARKDFKNIQEINAFLNPETYKQTNPDAIEQISKAVDIILLAVKNHQRIAVWGDFDVDGVTATAILIHTLREICHADAVFYVPNRLRESHGIKYDSAIQFIAKNEIEVFITCDTGINEDETLHKLSNLNLKIIVTDHHIPPKTLPNVDAVINPRLLPEGHVCRSLSGSGTAYMLAKALSRECNQNIDSCIDLAMLGTVADVVELRGENRFIVQRGLEEMNIQPRLAIQSMQSQLNRDFVNWTEEEIAYLIAPRLNAAGRLDDANFLVDFLLSNDTQKTNSIALKLEGLNTQRKLLVEQVTKSCEEILSINHQALANPILIMTGKNWPAGVLGLSANILAQKYHKPVIVFAQENQTIRGSARSYGSFDIFQALSACEELLLNFGGHPGAAGLSMPVENLQGFERKIQNAALTQQESSLPINPQKIDAYLQLSHINNSLLDQVRQIAPFGQGNPAPIFAFKSVKKFFNRYLDRSKEHAVFEIQDDDGSRHSLIHWNVPSDLPKSGEVDLLCHLRDSIDTSGEPWLEWVAERPTEKNIIIIDQEKPALYDFRFEPNQERIVQNLVKNYPHIQLWGVKNDSDLIKNQKSTNQLSVCDKLAILIPPAEISLITQVIYRCKPKEIFFFNFPHPWSEISTFLVHLGGLIKKASKKSPPTLNLLEICDSMNHSLKAVSLGISWWNANGDVNLIALADNLFTIDKPGIINKENQIKTTTFLNEALMEAEANRRFYTRVDLDSLFHTEG